VMVARNATQALAGRCDQRARRTNLPQTRAPRRGRAGARAIGRRQQVSSCGYCCRDVTLHRY
jgi:hypothetical protein